MEEPKNVLTQLPWPPRKVALATLIVVAIAAAFWIFIQFRLVFFSLFIAIVLSTAITPLVYRLEKIGVSRRVSLLLVALLVISLVFVIILLAAPLIINQWANFSHLMSDLYQTTRESLIQSPSLLVRRIAYQLPFYLPLTLPPPAPADAPPDQTNQFLEQIVSMGSAAIRSLLTIAGVGLLAAFWILESERTSRFFFLSIPLRYREPARDFFNDAGQKVGAYTRGLVILSLIVGAMTALAYIIIGLPNALLLGLLAGIMEAVPLVGPLLGAIPALAVAVSADPKQVVWVSVATIIIQLFENNLIVPRVMDRAVGVNPVASLLAFLTFGAIFGFTGAMLAIPLAAVIQLALRRFVFRTPGVETERPGGRDRISMLRYDAQELIQDVRKQVRQKEAELEASTDLVEDTIESIVQDLDSILAQIAQSNGENTR